MTIRIPSAVAVIALAAATLPAHAESNRLLPFWAQPYPVGFVQNEPGPGGLRRDCIIRHRIRTPHGFRTVVEDRCGPVLHARD